MTKTRSRWFRPRERAEDDGPRVRGQDAGPVTPVEPAGIAECLRACARYAGSPAAAPNEPSDPARAALAEALRALPTTQGDADAAGTLSTELLDALLDAGAKALACGPAERPLAVLLSNTVLTHRKDSRAGWRLRGRVLEAVGDLAGAVDAYERYLARTDRDSFGVAATVSRLTAALPAQRELAALLERLGAAAPPPGTGHPVEDLESAAEAYLERELAPSEGRPAADPALLARVAELYADQHRHLLRAPLPDPTVGGAEWLSLGEFRNLISGKSLCLVANSETVGRGSLGSRIDGYDVVVRFNSFRIDPEATGVRTDVHATGHRHTHNWDRPAGIRLVFCGESPDWRHALREHLVPGAQQHVGDESLRWPVRGVGRMYADVWPPVPTAGFNTTWLIDFLDVSPTFDLIGFDFFTTGAYRLPEAMRLPVPSADRCTREKAWVMERAQHVNGPVISLR